MRITVSKGVTLILPLMLIIALQYCNPLLKNDVQEPAEIAGNEDSSAIMIEVPLSIKNSDESFGQMGYSSVEMTDGNFAFVWESGDYSSRKIYFQILSNTGTPIIESGAMRLSDPSQTAFNPVIAAHPDAGAFVAYESKIPGGNSRIVIHYMDSNGTAIWPNEGVLAAKPSINKRYFFPNLIPGKAGDLYVSFMETGKLITNIKCQRIDPAGQRQWGTYGRDAGGYSGNKITPKGVLDNKDGLLVFWQNQREGNRQQRPSMLEGQRFDKDGTRLWGDKGLLVKITGLAGGDGYNANMFGIVPDHHGGAILAFSQGFDEKGTSYGVMTQRVSSNGNKLWGGGIIVYKGDENQSYESVISSRDGGAFVTVSLTETYQSILTLYRIGPDGKQLWSNEGLQLSHPRNFATEYSACGHYDPTSDRLRMVWTRFHDWSSYDFNVMAARFSGDGEYLDPPGGVTVISAADAQFVKQMNYNPGTGLWQVIWDDRRKSKSWEDMDIYTVFFNDAYLDTLSEASNGADNN